MLVCLYLSLPLVVDHRTSIDLLSTSVTQQCVSRSFHCRFRLLASLGRGSVNPGVDVLRGTFARRRRRRLALGSLVFSQSTVGARSKAQTSQTADASRSNDGWGQQGRRRGRWKCRHWVITCCTAEIRFLAGAAADAAAVDFRSSARSKSILRNGRVPLID